MEKANTNSDNGNGGPKTQCERDVAALRKQLKALETACPYLVRTGFVMGGVLGLAGGTLLGVWIGGRKTTV